MKNNPNFNKKSETENSLLTHVCDPDCGECKTQSATHTFVHKAESDTPEATELSDSPLSDSPLPDSLFSKSICSSTDCTGLMPTPPANEAELEAYEELYQTQLYPITDTI